MLFLFFTFCSDFLMFDVPLVIIFFLLFPKMLMCNFSSKQLSVVQPLEMMFWLLEMPWKCLLRCIRKMLIMFQTMSSVTLFLCLYGRSYGMYYCVLLPWLKFYCHFLFIQVGLFYKLKLNQLLLCKIYF